MIRAPVRSRIALALLGFLVLAIMAVTLTPTDTETNAAFGCLVCGERGLADVILNVIMFVPVGVLAAVAFGTYPVIVAAAAAFSAGVEAAQVFIPGRNPSAGDLLFNTAGALLGLALVALAPRWLRPGRRTLPLAVTITALICIGIVAATGRLMRPVFSDLTWYAQYTPDLSHLERYDGTVLDAAVGDMALPGINRLPRTMRDSVRDRLVAGGEVSVRVVVGTPPAGVAAFVTIYDELQREMLLLGADRTDLVLRMRIVAEEWRLDKPFPRLPGALAAYAPGDTIEVGGRYDEGTWCLRIEDATTCGIGMDASHGWSLLYSAAAFPPWLRGLISIGWLVSLAAFVGFYARTAATLLIGATGAFIAFGVIPAVEPLLLATSFAGIATAAAGFAAGAVLGRWLGVRAAPATP